MALHDPKSASSRRLVYADVMSFWPDEAEAAASPLHHKRNHILDRTDHAHLLIVPGSRDGVEATRAGRAVTVTIAAPRMPFGRHRRLLRVRAVGAMLDRFRPDLIECRDSSLLAWSALAHRRRRPATALVASRPTDPPKTYLARRFDAAYATDRLDRFGWDEGMAWLFDHVYRRARLRAARRSAAQRLAEMLVIAA